MDIDKPVVQQNADIAPEAESALLFRCYRCKLACHYVHRE